jgi:hypothetical protein
MNVFKIRHLIASYDPDLYLDLAYALYNKRSPDECRWRRLHDIYHIRHSQQIFDDYFLNSVMKIDTNIIRNDLDRTLDSPMIKNYVEMCTNVETLSITLDRNINVLKLPKLKSLDIHIYDDMGDAAAQMDRISKLADLKELEIDGKQFLYKSL